MDNSSLYIDTLKTFSYHAIYCQTRSIDNYNPDYFNYDDASPNLGKEEGNINHLFTQRITNQPMLR